MKKNNGITLVALVVMIIILLILASTAAYVGYDAIVMSKEQAFLNRFKEVYNAVELHSEDYKDLGLKELETEKQIEGKIYKYLLEDKEDYEKLGLSDINDAIYVNFDTVQIYSLKGIDGKHTLEDFEIQLYTPVQEEKNILNNISFEIKMEPLEYTWKYKINYDNITCNGNPQDGNLFYSEYIDGSNYLWKRVEKVSDGYELQIKDPGIYSLKFTDIEGKQSDIKQIYAYVKDGLITYYDGKYNENYKNNQEATIWTDLSGNENNGEIVGGNWVEDALNLDGTDDIIYTNIRQNFNNATIQQVYNMQNKIITETRKENITLNNKFDIGKYINNNDDLNYFKGNIYAFRIYNRELTQEEIEKNNSIDKMRYNIVE